MSTDYSKLQNGSDIRGIAMVGDDGKEVNLGKEEAFRLTMGFVKLLSRKTGKPAEYLKISVGHDSRLTARALKNAVISALHHAGAEAVDCGLASTPAMFMSTIFEEFCCDGAIMITARHLPYNRNGFKYFDRKGGLDKEDIKEIINSAEEEQMPRGLPETPETSEAGLMKAYAAHLRDKIKKETGGIEKPLTGLKIAVDAGNGAGGFYAREILEPLGADITGSRFLDPDGNFPNHAPNPEDKEAIDALCSAVKETGADLGIIFYTDVDRASAVDSSGKEINRNAIVAMAAALIAGEHPGTTVVTDSITSDQLTVYIEQCLGLKHLRFKRGYKNVINKAIELNNMGIDSQLAIETSGHAAYKENYFLDDGAYLATKIVIKAAQLKKAGADISVLLSSLEEPIQAEEYRFSIERVDFAAYADEALETLRDWVRSERGRALGASLAEPNYEGARINFDNEEVQGWCLLRKSLHDPKMPLNMEVNRGSCRTLFGYVREALEEYSDLK